MDVKSEVLIKSIYDCSILLSFEDGTKKEVDIIRYIQMLQSVNVEYIEKTIKSHQRKRNEELSETVRFTREEKTEWKSEADAKSSPLAKTCDIIGKGTDSPPAKPNTVGKENKRSLPEKRILSDENKEAKLEKEKPDFRTVNTKEDSKSAPDN